MKAAQLFDVGGRVAIVTGGAGGLGRAYAEAMLDNGADVMLLDRDAGALDRAVQELARPGRRVAGLTVDVTDRAALHAAFDQAVGQLGRLDIVFANVGIDAGPGFLSGTGERVAAGAIEAIPDALWDNVIDANLTSVFSTIRAAVPHLKRGGGGRIIVTSSIAGLRPG